MAQINSTQIILQIILQSNSIAFGAAFIFLKHTHTAATTLSETSDLPLPDSEAYCARSIYKAAAKKKEVVFVLFYCFDQSN